MVNWKWTYLEERTECILLALGILGWFTLADVRRLAGWAGPLVTVQRCSLQRPQWRPGLGGRHRILIPEGVLGWHYWRVILHEFAHPFLDVRFSEVLDRLRPEHLAAERARELVRVRAAADRWEEQLADEFTLALRLPGRLVDTTDRETLSERTGIPIAAVGRRLRRLEDGSFRLGSVPIWSAARRYHLEYHRRPSPTLRVVEDLAEGETARLVVPADRTSRRHRELRLKADLLALRPQELLTKYARYWTEPRRAPAPARFAYRLPVDLEELREWARERSERREDGRWESGR